MVLTGRGFNELEMGLLARNGEGVVQYIASHLIRETW